jgi:hypothetical protein
MITEDFVSFEIARLLKEKGFDIYVSSFYDVEGEFNRKEADWNWNIGSRYSAPTLQMAMKWLREVHFCHIAIDYTFRGDANLTNDYVSYTYQVENAKTFVNYISDRFFNSYEEACESAIKYCLEKLV